MQKISKSQEKLLIKNTKHFMKVMNRYDDITLKYIKDSINALLKERKKRKENLKKNDK